MEVQGEHGKSSGSVRGCERWRESSLRHDKARGWPYTGAARRCRRRGARPRPVALPEAKRAFWCGPGVLVVVVQAERRGEREQGELQESPELVRPLAELGGVGRAQ